MNGSRHTERKIGNALGTPEGRSSATLRQTGRAPLASVLVCQCGAKVESKECLQGGRCTCGPGKTPSGRASLTAVQTLRV